jgi:hypothetical protein
MTLNAEHFTVGNPVTPTDGLCGDVVVLGSGARDARAAAACMTMPAALAFAPATGPYKCPVLDFL